MDTLTTTREFQVGQRAKHPVAQWLEHETADLLTEIQTQEFWSVITSQDTDPAFAKAIMREVYYEIVGYQPHVIEAAIAAIGQMPRSMNPRLVKSMLDIRRTNLTTVRWHSETSLVLGLLTKK